MHPLSWKELGALVTRVQKDFINGPTSSQARLRLFGQPESSVRVTLYRYVVNFLKHSLFSTNFHFSLTNGIRMN